MAKRRKPKGLSVDKGQFVKAIGYSKSKSGAVQARRWYLGAVDDGANAALAKADRIKAAWKAYKAAGASVWPEGVNPLADGFELPRIEDNAPAVPSNHSAATLTVGAARDKYLADIKRRYEAGQVSHAYYVSETFNLKRGVAMIGTDKPLATIGAAELTAAVLAIAARPLAIPRKGQKTAPEPISVKSAKSYLNSLKAFLDEMSKTESAPGTNQPLWVRPLRFHDIFRDNQPKPTTAELDQLLTDNAAEADAFTIDELIKLYEAAPDRQRLWIALALNCGFASMELNTLTVGQCVGLDTGAPKIRRFRGKTGVYAEWPLWKETADLLRMAIANDERANATDAALVTENGKPLIEPRNMGRRDAVRSAWENIVSALPEDRRLSPKYLRKSGARLIRTMPEFGGDDVAEMYLAHADGKGILKHYSGRDWGRLATALTELRKRLEPMFKADKFHAVNVALFEGRMADAQRLMTDIEQAKTVFTQ